MVTKALTIYSMALIACRMAGLDKYFPESSYPTCLGLNGSRISSQQPRGTFRETVTKPISSTDIPTLYHKRSTDPNPQHACITGESLVAKEKPLQKWNKFSPHSYHGIGIAPRLQDSIPHGGPHRVNHFCKRGQVPSQYLNLILYLCTFPSWSLTVHLVFPLSAMVQSSEAGNSNLMWGYESSLTLGLFSYAGPDVAKSIKWISNNSAP